MLRTSYPCARMRRLLFTGAAVFGTACADRAAEEPAEEVGGGSAPAGQPAAAPTPNAQFAPSLDVELTRMTRTPTGLYIEDIQEGSGEEASPGQEVAVHYTGWLPSGQEFDNSHDRGEPITFPLGAGAVIAGWDEGIAGMRPGGRRKLVIPPELAYGAEGRPPVIPPNATLVFDVELVEIR